jgi:glycerol-3-phosphate acyltransferase PlsY
MLNIIFAVIIAYLIGSIPTSYLAGKIKGIDVRKEGSGNVGATNVLRVVGKLPALIVLIVDILKGVIAVTFVATFFYARSMPIDFNILRVFLGISVIAGHNRSVFLKLKGGKGVATSCGVLMVLLPVAMTVATIVFFVTVWRTKYVSLGSILLSMTVPIVAALMGKEIEWVILSVTICILISYRHKDNIKRLLMGTENKIGSSKVSAEKS